MIVALLTRYWRPLAAFVMVAAALLAAYGKGRNDERRVWVKRTEALIVGAEKRTQRLIEKNYVIEQSITQVIDRERVVTRNIIERIDREVPATACPIDGSYRVFHDAAARGEDPAAASGANAAAVPVKDAARTVVDNYGACREDQQRLIALQQWARDIASNPVLCANPN